MPLFERVRWRGDQKSEFVRWFHEQLTDTMADRVEKETAWADALVQWRARLPTGVKEFPWEGASNLNFPLTAMHSDPVYADMMQTFHPGTAFWNAEPRRNDRVAHANSIREGLAAVDRDFLHMREVNAKPFLENILFGTAIYKPHWLFMRRNTRAYERETGQIVKRMIVRSQPLVEYVPLNYFYIPANAWDIDPDAPVGGARWVAQKFTLRGAQLKARAREDGLFQPHYDRRAADRVGMYEQEDFNEDALESKIREEDDNYVPFENREIVLWEVWVRWDVDGDGLDEDVVVHYHRETDEILRALHNPFFHGQRPFEAVRYLQTLGFYGMGLAERGKWAQETTTKLLNATIDNVLLANTRMFSAPLGSNVEPGEPIYPGKIWMVGPGEEIGEVRLGDINQSLPLITEQVIQWAELANGVPDVRQGDISSLPSRTPAQTTESLLREGKRRFDEIFASMRVPLGRVGLRVLQTLAQYYQEDPERWGAYFRNTIGLEDGARVEEVLAEPVDAIGETYGITTLATSAQANRFAERQELVGVLQLLAQIYPQLVQTALLIEQFPPGSLAGDTALGAYTGGVELLKRLLERFDIQNPEQYVPTPQAIQQLTAQRTQAAGAPPVQIGPFGSSFGSAPIRPEDLLASVIGG